MKIGLIAKNSAFWDWHKRITMDNSKPETRPIKLMDEQGSTAMTWTITNATPVKDSYILTQYQKQRDGYRTYCY